MAATAPSATAGVVSAAGGSAAAAISLLDAAAIIASVQRGAAADSSGVLRGDVWESLVAGLQGATLSQKLGRSAVEVLPRALDAARSLLASDGDPADADGDATEGLAAFFAGAADFVRCVGSVAARGVDASGGGGGSSLLPRALQAEGDALYDAWPSMFSDATGGGGGGSATSGMLRLDGAIRVVVASLSLLAAAPRASLAAHQTAGQCSVSALALSALAAVTALLRRQGSAKKVFTTLLAPSAGSKPSMLEVVLLARSHAAATPVNAPLLAHCDELLEVVLFRPADVLAGYRGALAGAFGLVQRAALAYGARDATATPGSPASRRLLRPAVLNTERRLFDVLRAAAASPSPPTVASVLDALPFVLSAFVKGSRAAHDAAVDDVDLTTARPQDAAAAAAVAAAAASASSASKRKDGTAATGKGGAAGGTAVAVPPPAAVAAAASLGRAPEFSVLMECVSIVLGVAPVLTTAAAAAAGGAALADDIVVVCGSDPLASLGLDAPAAATAAAAGSAADLAGTARQLRAVGALLDVALSHNMYAIHEDAAPYPQTAVLFVVARWAAAAMQRALAADSADTLGAVSASFAVLGSLLELNHGVVQPLVEPILAAVLLRRRSPASASSTSSPPSSSSAATTTTTVEGECASFCCRLVATFSRLRQLDVMLGAYVRLLQLDGSGAVAVSSGDSGDDAEGLLAVLLLPSHAAAVSIAFEALPPGQVDAVAATLVAACERGVGSLAAALQGPLGGSGGGGGKKARKSTSAPVSSASAPAGLRGAAARLAVASSFLAAFLRRLTVSTSTAVRLGGLAVRVADSVAGPLLVCSMRALAREGAVADASALLLSAAAASLLTCVTDVVLCIGNYPAIAASVAPLVSSTLGDLAAGQPGPLHPVWPVTDALRALPGAALPVPHVPAACAVSSVEWERAVGAAAPAAGAVDADAVIPFSIVDFLTAATRTTMVAGDPASGPAQLLALAESRLRLVHVCAARARGDTAAASAASPAEYASLHATALALSRLLVAAPDACLGASSLSVTSVYLPDEEVAGFLCRLVDAAATPPANGRADALLCDPELYEVPAVARAVLPALLRRLGDALDSTTAAAAAHPETANSAPASSKKEKRKRGADAASAVGATPVASSSLVARLCALCDRLPEAAVASHAYSTSSPPPSSPSTGEEVVSPPLLHPQAMELAGRVLVARSTSSASISSSTPPAGQRYLTRVAAYPDAALSPSTAAEVEGGVGAELTRLACLDATWVPAAVGVTAGVLQRAVQLHGEAAAAAATAAAATSGRRKSSAAAAVAVSPLLPPPAPSSSSSSHWSMEDAVRYGGLVEAVRRERASVHAPLPSGSLTAAPAAARSHPRPLQAYVEAYLSEAAARPSSAPPSLADAYVGAAVCGLLVAAPDFAAARKLLRLPGKASKALIAAAAAAAAGPASSTAASLLHLRGIATALASAGAVDGGGSGSGGASYEQLCLRFITGATLRLSVSVAGADVEAVRALAPHVPVALLEEAGDIIATACAPLQGLRGGATPAAADPMLPALAWLEEVVVAAGEAFHAARRARPVADGDDEVGGAGAAAGDTDDDDAEQLAGGGGGDAGTSVGSGVVVGGPALRAVSASVSALVRRVLPGLLSTGTASPTPVGRLGAVLRLLRAVVSYPGVIRLRIDELNLCTHAFLPFVTAASSPNPVPVAAAAGEQGCRLLLALLKFQREFALASMPTVAASLGGLMEVMLGDAAAVQQQQHPSSSALPMLSRVLEQFAKVVVVARYHAVGALMLYLQVATAGRGRAGGGGGAVGVGLPEPARRAVTPGVFALLNVLAAKELQQLHTGLAHRPAARAMLKSLHDAFSEQHKFGRGDKGGGSGGHGGKGK